MNRIERLLEHIDVARQQGLEIGALCNPVVAPDSPGISYVDHLDTEGLRRKYAHDPNVDTARIVPVRYVWSGGSLADVVGTKRFGYVVASHVAEHVADLVGWLGSIAQVLHPGGVLALALPDKRYTFDCRRNLSTIADLLEAYILQYRRPSTRQALDHFVHMADVPGHATAADLWRDPSLAARVPRSHPGLLQALGVEGLRKHHEAILAGEYIDSHCTVVTPDSFGELLAQLASLGLLDFSVKSMHPTAVNDMEFFVCLERLPDAQPAARQRDGGA